MAQSIYNFSAALGSTSVARPDKFRVLINFPSALVDNANDIKHKASFLISQAQLPSYRTQDTQIYYRGRVFHEAGEKEYDQWTCTFYNDSDWNVRGALEAWAEGINNAAYNYGMTRPELYKSTIFIEQLDRADNCLKVYKLIGAFPTDTGQVELTYQNGNEVQQIQTTFVYDYFEVGDKSILEES